MFFFFVAHASRGLLQGPFIRFKFYSCGKAFRRFPPLDICLSCLFRKFAVHGVGFDADDLL